MTTGPSSRLAEPEEIAAAVAVLEATTPSFMTASTFHLHGALHAKLLPMKAESQVFTPALQRLAIPTDRSE